MKRFIFSILCVSVFFVGVGALVDKAGATFKSDEKALDLVRKARVAIGGDSAIAGVQSMLIVGQTTRTIKADGVDRVHQGETEIALQLPDKLMKMMKITHGDDSAGAGKKIDKVVDVVVVSKAGDGAGHGAGSGSGVKRVSVTKADGAVEELSGTEADKVIVHKTGDKIWTTEDGKTIKVDGSHVFMKNAGEHHAAMRQNELLRLTLGLLLTAPQGMDVSYTFGGESSVDGTACNIVVAEYAGASFRIYLGQSSNLPVMMTYTGTRMPVMVRFDKEVAPPADGTKDTMIFRTSGGPAPEKAEFSVRFSDYRSVGGVQLPYKWTQTVGGVADETLDVTSYEINPANIGEKFQREKVMLRTKKEQ